MKPRPDHYRILGIQTTATLEQIKAAYHRQAHKYHPDKNPSSEDAAERFKQCSDAYSVLSDPDRRLRYDRDLQLRKIQEKARDFIDDLVGPKRQRRSSGRDLRYELTLSFKEAALGATRQISFDITVPCEGCGGRGADVGGLIDCPDCGGKGEVKERPGFFSLPRPCARCGGQGIKITQACGSCDGIGTVEQTRQYLVKLPPGTRNGDVKIVDGAGEPGNDGGATGDLHVSIHVRPHPLFEQDGLDLVVETPISISVAALGGVVDVPTLTGKVRMKVPAGTQSGRIFRLKHKGLTFNGNVGDQLVHVIVETPVELGPDQRRLLETFGESCAPQMHPLRQAFEEKLVDDGE